MESMNSFQLMTRREIGMLQDRMAYIEQLVEKISNAVSSRSYPPPPPMRQSPRSAGATGRPTQLSSPTAKKPVPEGSEDWDRVLDYIKVRPSAKKMT